MLDAGQTTPDEDTAAETAANEDQIERIGEAMRALPKDAYQRHVGAFAREVVDSLGSVPPKASKASDPRRRALLGGVAAKMRGR